MYRWSGRKHNLNSACKKSVSPREESPAAMQWGQERVGLSHSMERQALYRHILWGPLGWKVLCSSTSGQSRVPFLMPPSLSMSVVSIKWESQCHRAVQRAK